MNKTKFLDRLNAIEAAGPAGASLDERLVRVEQYVAAILAYLKAQEVTLG